MMEREGLLFLSIHESTGLLAGWLGWLGSHLQLSAQFLKEKRVVGLRLVLGEIDKLAIAYRRTYPRYLAFFGRDRTIDCLLGMCSE